MTPLTLAEQSFLKIDTPQQVKPAAAKSGSADEFGNVMARAQGIADPETTETEAVVSTAVDGKAEATSEKSQKPANSTEAPKPLAQKATLTGDAPVEVEAEIPVMARAPEGGLTTKSAPKGMNFQVQDDATKPIKLTETVNARPTTVASLRTKASDQSKDVTKTVSTDVISPELAADTSDKAADQIVSSEAAQTESPASPEVRECLQTLSATTSAAALNVQTAVASVETAPSEKPTATLAALSLRAQMGEKPTKAASAQTSQSLQVGQKVTVADASSPKVSAGVPAAGKVEASKETADITVTAALSKGAGNDAETAKPLIAKAEIKDAKPAQEGETVTPEAQENAQTLAVATAGAAVAAPVTPRTSDKPANGVKSSQPLNTVMPNGVRRTEQSTNIPQARTAEQVAEGSPVLAPRVSSTLRTEASDGPASFAEKSAATGEKPDFALKMENMIQQAVSKDVTSEAVDVSAALTEVAQPAQPLPQTAVAAPQLQVVASPESFQQVEAAVKSAVAQELAMDEATWPETMVQDIGFETLADGEALEIQLTPENLGRVQLRMELRDGAASVTIVTETSEAAKQFNDNQQKLADLLAKQGVELANHNAGTGRDMGRGGSDGQNGNGSASSLQNDTADGTGQTEVATARKDPNRLVDVQA